MKQQGHYSNDYDESNHSNRDECNHYNGDTKEK